MAMITSMLVPVRSERLISVRLISWADATPAMVATANAAARAASEASEVLKMAGMLVPPLKGTIFAHSPTTVERPGWIYAPAAQKNANAETEASAFAVVL